MTLLCTWVSPRTTGIFTFIYFGQSNPDNSCFHIVDHQVGTENCQKVVLQICVSAVNCGSYLGFNQRKRRYCFNNLPAHCHQNLIEVLSWARLLTLIAAPSASLVGTRAAHFWHLIFFLTLQTLSLLFRYIKVVCSNFQFIWLAGGEGTCQRCG